MKSFLKCHSMHLLLHNLFLHSTNYHGTFEYSPMYLFHENAISKKSSTILKSLLTNSFLKDLLLFYISLSNKIHTIDENLLCYIKLEKHYIHPRFLQSLLCKKDEVSISFLYFLTGLWICSQFPHSLLAFRFFLIYYPMAIHASIQFCTHSYPSPFDVDFVLL